MLDEWRHIILYAKGWYRRCDTMMDLRQIISVVTGLETRFVHEQCIYRNVAHIFNLYMPQHTKDLFLEELFANTARIPMFFVEISLTELVEKMLSKLSCLKVRDGDVVIFDLGKPDENILPRAD